MHRIGVHSYNILWWIPASMEKQHYQQAITELLPASTTCKCISHKKADMESNDVE